MRSKYGRCGSSGRGVDALLCSLRRANLKCRPRGLPPADLGVRRMLTEQRPLAIVCHRVIGRRRVLSSAVKADMTPPALWWEGDRLVGFLGFYASSWRAGAGRYGRAGRSPARNRGHRLGRRSFLCRERADPAPLLIVPRRSEAGSAWRCAVARCLITQSMLSCYPASRRPGCMSSPSACARLPRRTFLSLHAFSSWLRSACAQ